MLDLKEILSLMKNPDSADEALIDQALIFATRVHEGQTRYSGEPYIIHPFTVAKTLAEMGADVETISAGLLHDTVEDHPDCQEKLLQEFGPTIAFLVEGVTKLGKLKYQGDTRHVESLRKLFVAMAEDLRVILIRLADRLHNIQTLKFVPKEKQQRIAIETLEIYAPLANRLGMWKIKGILEDASFPYAYPKEYKQVVALRKSKGKELIKKLEKVYRTLSQELAQQGLKDFEIDYRIKYLYSLYQKLKRHHMDINEIYDLSALRVVVNSIPECYQVLGIIHNSWLPINDRWKDYIAHPKPNGYRSIHTAVFTGESNIIEIQIRTREMHHDAEYGIASHLIYDENGKPQVGGMMTKNLIWLQELIEWQKHVNESDEFLHNLKTDLFHDRIFVFTPKGEVIELPKEATALDFAYHIHSDIGHRAVGAWVNGKFTGLDHLLKNRDLIRIETKKTAKPTVKWLDLVKTTTARGHIRRFLQGKKTKG